MTTAPEPAKASSTPAPKPGATNVAHTHWAATTSTSSTEPNREPATRRRSLRVWDAAPDSAASGALRTDLLLVLQFLEDEPDGLVADAGERRSEVRQPEDRRRMPKHVCPDPV